MNEIKYMSDEEFSQIIEDMEEMSRLIRRYNTIRENLKVTIKEFEDLSFTDEQSLIVNYVNDKIANQLKKALK